MCSSHPESSGWLIFGRDQRPFAFSISPTEFIFLSKEFIGFKVCTLNYNDSVIITFQDNSFYSVSFHDLEFKILGITGAEKVLDAVKDFVENGEVWV